MNKKFNQRVYDLLSEGRTSGANVTQTMSRVGRAIRRYEMDKDKARSQGDIPKVSLTDKKNQANRINRRMSTRQHPKMFTGKGDTPEKRKNRGAKAYYQGKTNTESYR